MLWGNKITAIEYLRPDTIRVHFDDGTEYDLQQQAEAIRPGIFATLGDSDCFAGATIEPGGWSLVFPSGVDYGADSLHLRAESLVTQH